MIQIYLLDLKNGLELKDFATCPNVHMVKTVADALSVLSLVRDEMRSRFEFLEKHNLNKIVPSRDKKDRLVVVVDEASVLYATGRMSASDKETAQSASQITDEIAKLSRAAAIHLILATQKVTKETISTHIQENLEGRMCFEVNSLQGSNMVLGTGAAKDLPHIPGRGIWKVGAKMVEVQTPYLEDEEIRSRCKTISDEFKSGKRKLFGEMFSPKQASKASSQVVSEITMDADKDNNG